MRVFILVAASIATLPLFAAEKPVPVRDEPMHQVVFENDFVRVIDVQIPPGETSLYHIHVIPSVIVYLTKSTNRSESWPDRAILTRDVMPAQSRYAPYDEKPLTHRVTNTGTGLFRVFDIELLKKPSAHGPLAAMASAGVKPHWEEKLARSSGVQLEPKARTEIPATRCASLVVAIAGAVQITSGRPATTRTLKWGEYAFFPPHLALTLVASGAEKAEAVLLELTN